MLFNVQMTQTAEFMFSNMAYRATLYKAGVSTM